MSKRYWTALVGITLILAEFFIAIILFVCCEGFLFEEGRGPGALLAYLNILIAHQDLLAGNIGVNGFSWRPVVDVAILVCSFLGVHFSAKQFGLVARSVSDRQWVRIWAAISTIVVLVSIFAGPKLMGIDTGQLDPVTYVLAGSLLAAEIVGVLGLAMWLVASLFGRISSMRG